MVTHNLGQKKVQWTLESSKTFSSQYSIGNLTMNVQGVWHDKNKNITWRGDLYSDSKGNLKKNDANISDLKMGLKNFEFLDCGNQLCIFGIALGASNGFVTDENLNLILWPSKKRIVFSNPCESPTVVYDFKVKKTDSEINIKTACLDYSKNLKIYSGELALEDIVKN